MFISAGRAKSNYESNVRADLRGVRDERGLLNGQGREALASLRFGYAKVGHSGCEAIAVYNVLRLLGKERPLPEIIRDLERGGYLRFGGHMGATPFLLPLLRRYGLRCRLVFPARLGREAAEGALAPGSVFLAAVWNRRVLPYKGMHTFALTYDPAPEGGWLAFNRFNADRGPRRCADLADVLRNGPHRGAYFLLYRLE